MSETLALTGPERDVLEVLAEGMSTSTVVRLSADLYRRGGDERFDFGDPIGFVTWLLEALNVNGYVRYRVATTTHDDAAPFGFSGLPFDIRLTPKGWAVLGYRHASIEVGRNPGMREVSVADRTDYRNHHVFAEGGPIEDHPWWDCVWIIPLSGKETNVTDVPTRTYVKVTPDMEARVLAAYGRTGSYEKTARETNLDERRVRYIVNDRPRLGRDTSSLKQRMLDLIIERGPYLDMMALHKDIPGPHGLHNLVHLLHSLHKAQLIDFRVENKGKDTDYLNIRARKNTNGQTLSVGETSVNALTLDPVPPTSVVAPTPEPISAEGSVLPPPIGGGRTESEDYPILTGLVSRSEANAEARRAATQYLAAAEALQAVDPVMAETLLAKAADVDGPIMSPVESEYLAYAEAHPHDD